jgi:hypothetical protein
MTTKEILQFAETRGAKIIGRNDSEPHLVIIPPIKLFHQQTKEAITVALVGKEGTKREGKILDESMPYANAWIDSSPYFPLVL